jgi:hypothetical protein
LFFYEAADSCKFLKKCVLIKSVFELAVLRIIPNLTLFT